VLIVNSPSIVIINNSYQNHTKYIITTVTKGTYGMHVRTNVYGAHVLRLLNLHTLDYFHLPTDTVNYCTKLPSNLYTTVVSLPNVFIIWCNSRHSFVELTY